MRYNFYDKDEKTGGWINDLYLSQGLDYSESVYSAQLAYSRQWSEQLSYKIGLNSDYDVTRTTLFQTNEKNKTYRFYP